jgi:hypothetical protein
MAYHINLNKITWEATEALLKLDETFVGTPNYLGITYFWHYNFRHYLRDTGCKSRVKIHNAFLKAGLDVGGFSVEHIKIVCKYCTGMYGAPVNLKNKIDENIEHFKEELEEIKTGD